MKKQYNQNPLLQSPDSIAQESRDNRFQMLRRTLPRYLRVGDSFDQYPPGEELSIAQHKRNKANNIIGQIQQIENQAPNQPDTHRAFRFYNGQPSGLQSLAERQGQKELPGNIRDHFLTGHMNSNEKAISFNNGKSDPRTYYSPFVSTTDSLPHFLAASFDPAGDWNLRQYIFDRAPSIGSFSLPNSTGFLGMSSPPYTEAQRYPFAKDFSQREHEVAYHTDKKPLASYQSRNFNNPLLNQIVPEFDKSIGAATNGLQRNIDNPAATEYQLRDSTSQMNRLANMRTKAMGIHSQINSLPQEKLLNPVQRNRYEDLRNFEEFYRDRIRDFDSGIPVPREYNPNSLITEPDKGDFNAFTNQYNQIREQQQQQGVPNNPYQPPQQQFAQGGRVTSSNPLIQRMMGQHRQNNNLLVNYLLGLQ